MSGGFIIIPIEVGPDAWKYVLGAFLALVIGIALFGNVMNLWEKIENRRNRATLESVADLEQQLFDLWENTKHLASCRCDSGEEWTSPSPTEAYCKNCGKIFEGEEFAAVRAYWNARLPLRIKLNKAQKFENS